MRVYSLSEKEGSSRYQQAILMEYWFWQRGYEIIPFDVEQLERGEFDHTLKNEVEDILFIASVAVMKKVFERAGFAEVENIDFPTELGDYYGRKIAIETFKTVQSWLNDEPSKLPVHIKPVTEHKLFTGCLVEKFRDFIPLSHVPADTQVYVQEKVDLISEWRATILRNKVLNVAHYNGSSIVFPDTQVIREAVSKYTTSPVGYAIDFGVTTSGQTIIIEVNDGFALGNYGVRGYQYTAMVECRWREIAGLSDNMLGVEFGAAI